MTQSWIVFSIVLTVAAAWLIRRRVKKRQKYGW